MTILTERFWSKVNLDGCSCGHGCHRWTGAHTSRGYGSWGVNGKAESVHVLACEHFHGPIPDGWTVDHVYDNGCRHIDCVNRDHLEAVTLAENNRRSRVARGYCIGGQCGKGHPLTAETTYLTSRNRLRCRECDRDSGRRQYAREVEVAATPGVPTPREVRQWAKAHNIPIGVRGRVPREITMAYLEDRFGYTHRQALEASA